MTDPETQPAVARLIPRRVVLSAVVMAGIASWIVAGIVGANAWRTGFPEGSRLESAAGPYLVLSLLASALAALPFTFLQWVDPDQKQRWRSIGGTVGVTGCALFAVLWLLH
ncbi:MAG: hypothetical protein ACOH16_04795 [Propionibacteriaceae bacterium]